MEQDGLKVEGNVGAFVASLKRNNKQIRDDRATAIAEDTEVLYKRKVEDLELSIRKMQREQENMLDLSPTNAQSLVLASDFNSKPTPFCGLTDNPLEPLPNQVLNTYFV